MNTPSLTPATQPEDMAQSRWWTASCLSSPTRLPFSFVYQGKNISGIPETWHPATWTNRIDANLVETVYEATDPVTGLTVRVQWLAYQDFPVVEWTVWFSNTGDTPTPIISDIQAMELTLTGEQPLLYHCNGDFWNESGYTPEESPVAPGSALTFMPEGGRPCDHAFPYFRLQFSGCGATLAIGWPGQWAATFAGVGDGVAIQAGQQQTHLRLLPGECIRTPRITLLSWVGDTDRARNVWRRWYLAHVLPRPDGRPLAPMLAIAGTEDGEEFTGATEENQLRLLEKFARQGGDFDVWWIDAGWYPCRDAQGQRHWWHVGTWEPDRERFPRGFAPIAARAREQHARLLVWFEPERVYRGSRLWNEHADWLLFGDEKDDNALLNLGNPVCRQWLTDHVATFIRENGIGVYRQDFNFPPLDYWRRNEPADRQGINENLHVQGYLQYWDELLARNPGLFIDSCASGGRRNDLETMRRSVPLHYSDYGYGIPPVKLGFQQTLYEWIPYFKEVTMDWEFNQSGDDPRFSSGIDPFAFHCAMGAMMMLGVDIRRDDLDYALIRRMIALWRQAAPFILYGDYYPLTSWGRDADRWVAWQFDREESGAGVIHAMRLPANTEDSCIIRLKGVNANAAYRFENRETGEQIQLSGAALARDGFTLTLPPRTAVLWFYAQR